MSASVRNVVLALLAAGALVAAGHLAPAAGQAPGPPGDAPPAGVRGEAPAPAPTPEPTPTADAEEQLEEFVPSEKVPADQGVDFPVDI